MRLFIAINFPEDLKKRLYTTAKKLKFKARQGNFTYFDNLHFTLVFIGEVNPGKIMKIKKAMDRVSINPFEISFQRLDHLKKHGGEIYWIGIRELQEARVLPELYNQLCESLDAVGVNIEKRKLKPHLTLGRNVTMLDSFDIAKFATHIPKMQMTVDQVSLIQSEQIAGKLVYTKLYSLVLPKPKLLEC
jgi:2'-5' RNA ligase